MPEVETIRVIIPDSKIVKINVLLPGGGGGATFGPQTPHYFFAGPNSGSLLAIPSFRPAVEDDLPFAAMLDKPNVFTRENTIPGLRIGTRTITADYSVQATDCEILADASGGNITITLPSALATGQIFRVKRVDASVNTLTIAAQSTDLIDGQSTVGLVNQYDDAMLFDADIGVWDKFSGIGAGLPSDVARLSIANVFTNVNTFTGVQYATRTVTVDYFPTPLDYEVLVDATSGPVSIGLPPSTGSGQVYHIKKIDSSANIVTVSAQGTDLIDGSISVNLSEQWADLLTLDAATGYWDNLGGAPLDLPPTADLARLSLPNVFLDVNTFTGLRIGTITVTANYTITHNDYEILVDATGGDITITLPAALATGQLYRIKRIDSSSNNLTVVAAGTDLIDADSSILMNQQYQVCTFVDADIAFWDKGLFIPPFILPGDLALLDANNVFTALNTFTGMQLSTKTVTTDYLLQDTDFEVLVDATAGPITVTLPPATATGQIFRVKKIDSSVNIVTVAAVGTDLIDGSISVNFPTQWSDCELVDAAVGYWDNTETTAGGGGGSADFGVNGRVRDLNPIRGFAFDVFDGASWIEQIRYTEPSTGPSPVTRVSYWYNPDITDLAGLKAWPTIGNMLDSRMDALYNAGSNVSGQFSIYLLKTGAAAGGDPGQVAPDDYNAGTNNVHWLQVL